MSLPRTPEPELMVDLEQARAYAAADFGGAHQAYVERVHTRFPYIPGLDEHAGGRALDLGCGPGDITIRFARAYPTLHWTGVDGSAAMLSLARAALAASELTASRIDFVEARIDRFAAEPFDFVVSNSLLHHLPTPSVLWETIARLARPGAAVFVGDLFRPESVDTVDHLVDRYAAGEPEVLREDFRASLHAAFTPDEVRAQLSACGLPFEVEVVSDRHLEVSGRIPRA